VARSEAQAANIKWLRLGSGDGPPFFMGKQMGKKKHDFETTNQIKLWLMIFVGMSCTSLKESGYN
jgi:hypothetical protein